MLGGVDGAVGVTGVTGVTGATPPPPVEPVLARPPPLSGAFSSGFVPPPLRSGPAGALPTCTVTTALAPGSSSLLVAPTVTS